MTPVQHAQQLVQFLTNPNVPSTTDVHASIVKLFEIEQNDPGTVSFGYLSQRQARDTYLAGGEFLIKVDATGDSVLMKLATLPAKPAGWAD